MNTKQTLRSIALTACLLLGLSASAEERHSCNTTLSVDVDAIRTLAVGENLMEPVVINRDDDHGIFGHIQFDIILPEGLAFDGLGPLSDTNVIDENGESINFYAWNYNSINDSTTRIVGTNGLWYLSTIDDYNCESLRAESFNLCRIRVKKLMPLEPGATIKIQTFLYMTGTNYHEVLSDTWYASDHIIDLRVSPAPYGDVNDDTQVDIFDVNAVVNCMLGNEEIPTLAADTNGDGVVDIFDVNEVVNAMLGKVVIPTTTYTVNGVSFKMVAVEGGTFTMGATAEQGSDAYDEEKPAHQVTLSSYNIGQTEVTQELWQAVMGSNPSLFTIDLQRPVECVSWYDCQTFITELNQLTGKNFRLPTEAEWEYAARGGNRSQGYKYAGSNTIGDVAWYTSNSNSTTHPVATKAPNELGIYDMSGNVWEWCQDWYGSYSSGAQTNPTGPASGSRRVYRGGCRGNDARSCRVSGRGYDSPSDSNSALGLRLAL